MSETLGQKQQRFTRLLPLLLNKIHDLGYEASLGDAYRDPRLHGALGVKMGYGHASSAHKQRLAIDLNLFKDGKYITDDEGHKLVGPWWKTQGAGCSWGGDWQDFNHYSIEVDGVR